MQWGMVSCSFPKSCRPLHTDGHEMRAPLQHFFLSRVASFWSSLVFGLAFIVKNIWLLFSIRCIYLLIRFLLGEIFKEFWIGITIGIQKVYLKLTYVDTIVKINVYVCLLHAWTGGNIWPMSKSRNISCWYTIMLYFLISVKLLVKKQLYILV